MTSLWNYILVVVVVVVVVVVAMVVVVVVVVMVVVIVIFIVIAVVVVVVDEIDVNVSALCPSLHCLSRCPLPKRAERAATRDASELHGRLTAPSTSLG